MTEIGILVEHLENPNYVIMKLENLGNFHAKMGVPLESIYTMTIVMQHFFLQQFSRMELSEKCEQAWLKVDTSLGKGFCYLVTLRL